MFMFFKIIRPWLNHPTWWSWSCDLYAWLGTKSGYVSITGIIQNWCYIESDGRIRKIIFLTVWVISFLQIQTPVKKSPVFIKELAWRKTMRRSHVFVHQDIQEQTVKGVRNISAVLFMPVPAPKRPYQVNNHFSLFCL